MNQQANLRKRLKDLEAQIQSLQKALEVRPEHGLGKGDPAVTQWELDQALLKQLQSRADRLRKALIRMEEGDYGICEQCGQPIHPDRLAILPDTRLCIQCARKGES
ncbi:MAG: TraR/DksA family transcriptional regulator [Anaerolineae bacterium]